MSMTAVNVDLKTSRNVIDNALVVGAIFCAKIIEITPRTAGNYTDSCVDYDITITLPADQQFKMPLCIAEDETLVERLSRIFSAIYDALMLRQIDIGNVLPVVGLKPDELTWLTQLVAEKSGANQSIMSAATDTGWKVNFVYPDGDVSEVEILDSEMSITPGEVNRYIGLCKDNRRKKAGV